MVKNRVGPPVRGVDLYGRDKFVELLWRKLDAGSVLLAAPRRFGKTSVMYKLIDEPRNDYRIVHADLEHLSDPVDLVIELVAKLERGNKALRLIDGFATVSRDVLTGLRDAVEEVDLFHIKLKLREQIRPQWQEFGRAIFKRIGQMKQPVLFILDELPMMIDRMERKDETRGQAVELLRWLRAIRMSPESSSVRFLIAGSIGIGAVLNRLGEISSINDFEQLKLEPFSEKVADQFLADLAEGEHITLSPDCRATMLGLIGILVPYFLQVLYSEVTKCHQVNDEEVTPEMIGRIYHEKVLGVECKTYFDHYYGRLRDYYSPSDTIVIKRLLRELAHTGSMSNERCVDLFREARAARPVDDEPLDGLLTDLENDFYIRLNPETQEYEFACKLLRDWWLRHHALELG